MFNSIYTKHSVPSLGQWNQYYSYQWATHISLFPFPQPKDQWQTMWKQRLWPHCAWWQQDQTKLITTTTASIPYYGRQHCGYGLKQGVLNKVLNFKDIFTAHFQWLSNITQVGVSIPSPRLANGVSAVAWAFCFCLTKGAELVKKKKKRNGITLHYSRMQFADWVLYAESPSYPSATV